ncbi:DNA repair protein RadC [bacterium]|nr:DNA repair protein RadC [bacterium]
MNLGPEKLSDAELIAILLGSGTGKVTAVDVAKRLLIEYKGLNLLSERPISDLKRMKGIGSAKAVKLMAAFEIGRRIASGGNIKKEKIVSPENVADYYIPLMKHLKKEVFKIVLLDSSNQIIKDVEISKGSLNANVVHPREVFKEAVSESAASIILIHNHPSGNAQPSEDDIAVTKKLVEAGKIMGILVCDHIIIGDGEYKSFANMGLI